MLDNLGVISSVLGRKEEAREYLEQALRISKEVGDRKGEGRALYKLGETCDELGQKEMAREYLKQALDIYRERRL